MIHNKLSITTLEKKIPLYPFFVTIFYYTICRGVLSAPMYMGIFAVFIMCFSVWQNFSISAFIEFDISATVLFYMKNNFFLLFICALLLCCRVNRGLNSLEESIDRNGDLSLAIDSERKYKLKYLKEVHEVDHLERKKIESDFNDQALNELFKEFRNQKRDECELINFTDFLKFKLLKQRSNTGNFNVEIEVSKYVIRRYKDLISELINKDFDKELNILSVQNQHYEIILGNVLQNKRIIDFFERVKKNEIEKRKLKKLNLKQLIDLLVISWNHETIDYKENTIKLQRKCDEINFNDDESSLESAFNNALDKIKSFVELEETGSPEFEDYKRILSSDDYWQNLMLSFFNDHSRNDPNYIKRLEFLLRIEDSLVNQNMRKLIAQLSFCLMASEEDKKNLFERLASAYLKNNISPRGIIKIRGNQYVIDSFGYNTNDALNLAKSDDKDVVFSSLECETLEIEFLEDVPTSYVKYNRNEVSPKGFLIRVYGGKTKMNLEERLFGDKKYSENSFKKFDDFFIKKGYAIAYLNLEDLTENDREQWIMRTDVFHKIQKSILKFVELAKKGELIEKKLFERKKLDKRFGRKIFILGPSFGGCTVANLLTFENHNIDGVISWDGILDFNTCDWRNGRVNEDINPIKNISRMHGNMLILQAENDNNVEMDAALNFIKALKKLKNKSDLKIFPFMVSCAEKYVKSERDLGNIGHCMPDNNNSIAQIVYRFLENPNNCMNEDEIKLRTMIMEDYTFLSPQIKCIYKSDRKSFLGKYMISISRFFYEESNGLNLENNDEVQMYLKEKVCECVFATLLNVYRGLPIEEETFLLFSNKIIDVLGENSRSNYINEEITVRYSKIVNAKMISNYMQNVLNSFIEEVESLDSEKNKVLREKLFNNIHLEFSRKGLQNYLPQVEEVFRVSKEKAPSVAKKLVVKTYSYELIQKLLGNHYKNYEIFINSFCLDKVCGRFYEYASLSFRLGK